MLATKCGMIWDREEGEFFFHANRLGITQQPSEMKVYKCLRPESIRQELERSLKRLGTDHVDLYQTHWQESTTPIADTMDELLRLKRGGQNPRHRRLQRQRRADAGLRTDRLGPGEIQPAGPEIEEENLPYCRRENIAVLAYSPLANGLLTGRIRPDRQFAPGDLRRNNRRFMPENIEADQRRARTAPPDRRPPRCDDRAVGHRLDVFAAGPDLCALRRPQPAAGHRQRRRRRHCPDAARTGSDRRERAIEAAALSDA